MDYNAEVAGCIPLGTLHFSEITYALLLHKNQLKGQELLWVGNWECWITHIQQLNANFHRSICNQLINYPQSFTIISREWLKTTLQQSSSFGLDLIPFRILSVQKIFWKSELNKRTHQLYYVLIILHFIFYFCVVSMSPAVENALSLGTEVELCYASKKNNSVERCVFQ